MKVTVEFDTEAKSLTVKEDGAEMPNVDGVSFYKDCYCSDDQPEKFSMSVTQRGKRENGVTKTIYSVAKILGYTDEN
jgi:hypothetical protein